MNHLFQSFEREFWNAIDHGSGRCLGRGCIQVRMSFPYHSASDQDGKYRDCMLRDCERLGYRVDLTSVKVRPDYISLTVARTLPNELYQRGAIHVYMTHWHATIWNNGLAKNAPGFLDGVKVGVMLDANQSLDNEAKWHAVSLVEYLLTRIVRASHASGVAWPGVSFVGCEAVPIKTAEELRDEAVSI